MRVKMHEYLNSFHCTALKAGISTKLHNPEWTKKVFIPSMQVTNLPGYVHIPILHISNRQDASKSSAHEQFSSWNRCVFLKHPTAPLQTPNPGASKFYGKLEILISLRRCAAFQLSQHRAAGQVRWPCCGSHMFWLQVKALGATAWKALFTFSKFFLHVENNKSFNSYLM